MFRKLSLLLLLGLLSLRAFAYDFAVPLPSGDSLFFSVLSSTLPQVAIVPPQTKGPNYYRNHQRPSGTLIIPSTVQHNGVSWQVVAVADRAFASCTALQRVVLPESVTSIGAYAFYGCTGLKGTLVIGPNIQTIGASAYHGCSSISIVLFRATNCTFMGGSLSTAVFANCRNLRRIIVDSGVQSIPDFAFCAIDALSDSLALPTTLKHIGSYAFAYCSRLSGNLHIPDSTETLGDCAFHQCHSLKTLTLGSSLRKIGGRAFYHCVGIKHIIVNALYPPEITVTTFSDLSRNVKLSLPCLSKSLYTNSGFWKKFTNVESFGPCTVAISASMQNPDAGLVLGAGNYRLGDTATLMALCAHGFGFSGWSDGNTENPRRFAVQGPSSFSALTIPSGITTIVDTLLLVDTVYADGIKVIHDTVELADVARSINYFKELKFDPSKKQLKWALPRGEKVLSVSIYNQMGECVHSGSGRKGSVNMRRFPAGAYIVRIETLRRVFRCRLFLGSDSPYAGELSIQ